MSVGLFGANALIKNLRKAREAADKAAEREVKKAMKAVETEAKLLINKGPATGIVYKRGNITHRASAPGEAPMTQPVAFEGSQLSTHIESKMEIISPGVASAVVWTEIEYGKWLEFGTGNMEPRPWLTPAVEKNRERFPNALGKAVIKSVDDAVKK